MKDSSLAVAELYWVFAELSYFGFPVAPQYGPSHPMSLYMSSLESSIRFGLAFSSGLGLVLIFEFYCYAAKD